MGDAGIGVVGLTTGSPGDFSLSKSSVAYLVVNVGRNKILHSLSDLILDATNSLNIQLQYLGRAETIYHFPADSKCVWQRRQGTGCKGPRKARDLFRPSTNILSLSTSLCPIFSGVTDSVRRCRRVSISDEREEDERWGRSTFASSSIRQHDHNARAPLLLTHHQRHIPDASQERVGRSFGG
ncbi:hypothetical protein ARMSODRAFT_738627 [Armillaria solidipes]|uniref:Uncharacterized protein n=1 Tax=Armillaria solidipes TaxID=1076256 RepID=A0A2H3B1Z7_9AGAR|nr:hypothetical protein ARMSODRAFT_738627 [Armillaria solidipes]